MSIKVIVVDDSAFMRNYLSMLLESDKDIKVIGTAKDGNEGYNLVKKLNPDLVTMDIEMPVMDGLTSLQKIMKDCPVPVIIVSSITTEGAQATIKALEYGAIDVLPKDLSYFKNNFESIKEEFTKRIKEISRNSSIARRLKRVKINDAFNTEASKQDILQNLPKIRYRAVAIGISTGGPLSLQKVIPCLSPAIKVPVFIVQHMPPKFTKSLAERLNGVSKLPVKEAENNERVEDGFIYIAPGGYQMTVTSGSGGQYIKINDFPNDTLHRPSVDVMMNSVVEVFGKYMLGIIMTGMGKDGLEGIRKLKSAGGYCIAQSESSCVIYGMPKAIVDAGFADITVSLDNISQIINKALL